MAEEQKINPQASERMNRYFESLKEISLKEHEIAKKARSKGYDPTDQVEVSLAANMAERVVGLISVVAPQIVGSGVVDRIIELEKEYGRLDSRVAMQIGLEVAQQRFCKFKDDLEAITIGVRVGFAYGTLGVVSSPLDGLVEIKIKNRNDGAGQYFCLYFAGPVRNAGGTAASWCVIIADHIRKKLGYAQYDPTENEIKRCATEIEDYHERVTNLQYFPSKKESEFLMRNIPVEVSGDASEEMEVSNYKDLPRVETNRIRSGYCLIHSSCIPLKAPKLWKELSKWGNSFSMEQWNFLEEFLKIQKEAKAAKAAAKSDKGTNKPKISPDYTYIKDLVAGRPVIGHPLRNGALRLRYGRARTSGFSAQCVHPATMHVLNNCIATGTQLKVERPGKGAAFTPCDTIEGPTVKLKDGSVMQISTEAEAKQIKKEVLEVIYLGDVLINYGDFLNRAHPLVPSGYCEEWWVQEVEKEINRTIKERKEKETQNTTPEQAQNTTNEITEAEITPSTITQNPPQPQINITKEETEKEFSEITQISPERAKSLLNNPSREKPTTQEAIIIAQKTSTPFHPTYTHYWNSINTAQLIQLLEWLSTAKIEECGIGHKKIVIFIKPETKRSLEIIGIPHKAIANEYAVIEEPHSSVILFLFPHIQTKDTTWKEKLNALISESGEDAKNLKNTKLLQAILPVKIRDKCGTFIGARMGRPEKAKQRELTGSPHTLFPVGEEGGRLRSFQAAMEEGKIKADFAMFICKNCKKETYFGVCPTCDQKTTRKYECAQCGILDEQCTKHERTTAYVTRAIDINQIFKDITKKIDCQQYPDLIKGVRGTSNKEHIPEHLAKGILRAKHALRVNKEGTIRYDCSELPVTHFKPIEVHTSIEKLKQLGYTHDIHGKPLETQEQILELYTQDIIIPCCPDSPDEMCDEVLYRTTKFIDDLLMKLYGLPPYYNLTNKDQLAGHLIIGLAPHTSAGTLGRIIGTSKTQAFFAHPLFHAAMRRDCDGDESCIFLLLDAFLNFSRKYLPESRGSTMDAPLVLTSILMPGEVDDMAFDVDRVYKYPLEMYEAALEYKMPWEIKINTIKQEISKPTQYEGMGFTHDTTNFNAGVLCSSYKTLPSMQEKLLSQMDIAQKIRAVDEADVAQLVIEKHFIRDIKGNLRKFSQQEFRCVNCNTKFRRPPLLGKCNQCNGNIIFTISEGSIIKYLEPSTSLANHYNLTPYLKQTLEIVRRHIEGMFGKEKEVQAGLGQWFG
jgi:DNA polymerase II large subunit